LIAALATQATFVVPAGVAVGAGLYNELIQIFESSAVDVLIEYIDFGKVAVKQ